MKRIVIDTDLCQGTKECAALAPGLVEFDDSGVAHVAPGGGSIDDELADHLVATCPSMAITAEPA